MAGNNGPKIVTSGLVLCVNAADRKSYPGSGATWFDLSGNNLNATIVNSPSFSGTNGGIFNIDTRVSSRYFQFPISSILNFQSSNFTLCLFWKPGDFLVSAGQYIVAGLSASYNIGYSQNDFGQYLLNFNTYTGGLYTATKTADYRSYQNVWHMTTVVRNGSSATIYANTTNVTNVAGTHGNPLSQTGSGLHLATSVGVAYGTVCNGDYSAFMAYNRALSVAEITQNFNAYRGRFSL